MSMQSGELTGDDNNPTAETQAAPDDDEDVLESVSLVKNAIRPSAVNKQKAATGLSRKIRTLFWKFRSLQKNLVNSLLTAMSCIVKGGVPQRRCKKGSNLFAWDADAAGKRKTDSRRSPVPFDRESALLAKNGESPSSLVDSEGLPLALTGRGGAPVPIFKALPDQQTPKAQ